MQNEELCAHIQQQLCPVCNYRAWDMQWLDDTPEEYVAPPMTAWCATLLSLNTLLWLPMNPIQQLCHPPTNSKCVELTGHTIHPCPDTPLAPLTMDGHVGQTTWRHLVSLSVVHTQDPSNTGFTYFSKDSFFSQDYQNGSLISDAFYYNGLFPCYICQTLWFLQKKNLILA